MIVAARARGTSLQLPQYGIVIFIIKDSGGDCKGNIWIFLGWADKNSGPVLWKLTAFHLGIGENQKNEEVGIRMGAFVK